MAGAARKSAPYRRAQNYMPPYISGKPATLLTKQQPVRARRLKCCEDEAGEMVIENRESRRQLIINMWKDGVDGVAASVSRTPDISGDIFGAIPVCRVYRHYSSRILSPRERGSGLRKSNRFSYLLPSVHRSAERS